MPNSGRPIPELVVGPFGVAVVHELGPREAIRRVGNTWETRTPDGWMPTEYPLERVNRDVERVRRWLTESDLDFVVRVYGALITTDAAIPRSPLCAVLAPEQIPAWFEALPRQRSLTAGRRNHLLARVRGAVAPSRLIGGWPTTEAALGPGSVGRGARTRTWNQRDISPPL